MKLHRSWFRDGIVLFALAGLTSSCAYHRKKYENPITKDTQQPDKVLFDKAIRDVERGRYEVARLTLNTLMNTYDQSEFMAKAKLAIADSWFREGGTNGLAQAEAEYKDFILFYPTMEESAEAQEKVCMIHFKQMEKPDRDPMHAQRAEEECRTLLTQFPNSKFAPQGQQILRNIQEVLAEGEFRVGTFYHTKGVYYSAANRLQGLTDHFPLYSRSDEALWNLGDSYARMGPKFRDRAAAAYSKLVEKYPLSSLADNAKKKLKDMEKPIPQPDPVALAWQKYELENQKKGGMMSHFWGIFSSRPDTAPAAKSGQPPMEGFRPQVPVTVPAAGATTSADVTATPISGPSALDTLPDARQGKQDASTSDQTQNSNTAQQPADPNATKNKKKK
jgi:outer membrane protein assembly factor BamD